MIGGLLGSIIKKPCVVKPIEIQLKLLELMIFNPVY